MAKGHIEAVPPSPDSADALITQARTHLKSAAILADSDSALAFDALHAANRKALTAVLLIQGLRPTRDGGHVSVYEAVRAQLDPPLGPVLLPYSRVRRARNAGDYLTEVPPNSVDVLVELPRCEAIVDLAERMLGQMPPY
jgi:hypothetical protein